MSATLGHVALVTTAEYAHLDEDLPPITAALEDLGVRVTAADWHDRSVVWDTFDLAVVRCPWDYTWHLDDFLAWIDRAGRSTTLLNPPDVLRWNVDKRYLVTLHDLGLPVVPTTVIEPGAGADPDAALRTFEDRELVVKPVVSGGARDTDRYPPGATAAATHHIDRLLAAGKAVLVQPYLDHIDEAGETGMVFLGDRFSHAFRKGPILVGDATFIDGVYREEDITPREPSHAERRVAEAVLDGIADALAGVTRRDLLYARVDLVPDPDAPDGLRLMELELVEPSYFCATHAGAAGTAAAAIAARLPPG